MKHEVSAASKGEINVCCISNNEAFHLDAEKLSIVEGAVDRFEFLPLEYNNEIEAQLRKFELAESPHIEIRLTMPYELGVYSGPIQRVEIDYMSCPPWVRLYPNSDKGLFTRTISIIE